MVRPIVFFFGLSCRGATVPSAMGWVAMRFLLYLSWMGIGGGFLIFFITVGASANGAHDPQAPIHVLVGIAILFLGAILRAVLAIEENTRRA